MRRMDGGGLLDLATGDAIDKTLQRLVAVGTLRRIARGLYDKPDFNSLAKAPKSPLLRGYRRHGLPRRPGRSRQRRGVAGADL